MNGSFSFRPVGHGLFYTGNIKYKDTGDVFNFIYDIGTLNSETIIEKEVDKYCEKVKKIDFVILSHLDKDHVIGLFHLLDAKIEIDAIIMPYLNPTRLMFLFEESVLNIDGRKIKPNCKDKCRQYFEFLYKFYSDPYLYIKNKKNNCKIILYSSAEISEIETINGEQYNLEEINNIGDELLKSFQSSQYVIKKGGRNLFTVHPKTKTVISYKGWAFDIKQPGFNSLVKTRMDHIKQNLLDVLLSNVDKKEKETILKEAKKYTNINNKDCITLEHYPLNSVSGKDHTLLTGDYDDKEIYTKPTGLLSLGNEYYVIQIPHHGSKIKDSNLTINSVTEYSVVCHRKDDPKHPNNQTKITYEQISKNPIQHVTQNKNSYFEYDATDKEMTVRHESQ